MEIIKSSSNYEIIDSGTLILFQPSSNISFKIAFSETFSFNLVFSFENIPGQDYSVEKVGDESTSTINFKCINFNNGLGTGTTQPIELATFNNKKIYINFWISSLGNNALKKMEYNIYQEV